MRICFIVTTYNVLPYLEKCLSSLADCSQPGDKVLIVDDGSTDGTLQLLPSIISKSNFDRGVLVEPLFLGVNTHGGVGIPANIGLSEALRSDDFDGVFFVDGDDWLLPKGFLECRRRFAMSRPEILIANYTEYDQSSDSFRMPADRDLWAAVRSQQKTGADFSRVMALRMISVPWRKFYSSEFLRRNSLRYPEGDFFFEDNPFHWQVCLCADDIVFENRELCAHRFNRPGQTMGSTGAELIAFFDHFETILDVVGRQGGAKQSALQVEALHWILTNMNWHIDRLQSSSCWAYLERAAVALKQCPENVWSEGVSRFSGQRLFGLASALRRGEVHGVATYLAQQSGYSAHRKHFDVIDTKTNRLLQLSQRAEDFLAAQRELMRFKALSEFDIQGKANHS